MTARRRRFRPWSFPLLMFAAAALALVSALVVVDRTGERLIDEEMRAAAAAEHDYLAALAREEGLESVVRALDQRTRLRPAGFRYSLTGPGGRSLAGDPSLNRPDPRSTAWRVTQPGRDGRDVHWQVVARDLPTGESLQVAQSVDRRAAFRTAIFEGSALAILLSTVACVAIGLALNAMLLSRARGIADTAARIAGGDMAARVETHHPGDVFDRLGASINQMLARIEELMIGMRTVTDSLAHDLRTPLTRMRGALSRAMAPGLAEADRLAAIEQAHDEAEHALATFTALLDIAQAETGLSAETMASVDLAVLVEDIAELFEPVIEDAGQTLSVRRPETPAFARAHELLLRQALGNLLHNAARYAGGGATIMLELRSAGTGYELVVSDDGPGVPAADRGRVQERFVRLDKARSGSGAGLGLAIVAACAKLHGGALVLEDNHPGLRAVLRLGTGTSHG